MGDLVRRPDTTPACTESHVPIERGVKVCLVDDQGYRVSEWVALVERYGYLFAEWSPGWDGFAYAFVAWDERRDLFAAGLLDTPVYVHPRHAPIELRVEGGGMRAVRKSEPGFQLERFVWS